MDNDGKLSDWYIFHGEYQTQHTNFEVIGNHMHLFGPGSLAPWQIKAGWTLIDGKGIPPKVGNSVSENKVNSDERDT